MSIKQQRFQIRDPAARGRKAAATPNAEEKILDAAEFVFGNFGFAGATTALIAKKAGVAKAHIYYYFEDKDDLYRAILERAMTLWAQDIAGIEVGGDLRTSLRDYIHCKVDFSRDHPSLSKIYAGEILSGAPFIADYITKISTPLLLDKVKLTEALIAQGVVRPISPHDLFFCIWAMTQAYADFSSQMLLMKQRRQLEEADFDTAKNTIVQLVFGGLGLALEPAHLIAR